MAVITGRVAKMWNSVTMAWNVSTTQASLSASGTLLGRFTIIQFTPASPRAAPLSPSLLGCRTPGSFRRRSCRPLEHENRVGCG